MQQTTEWSCGCVVSLLTLRYFGIAPEATEWSLAKALHTHTNTTRPNEEPGTAFRHIDYGTKLEEMHRYFSQLPGLRVQKSSYRERYRKEDVIKEGDPYPPCDRENLYPTFPTVEHFASWLEKQLRHQYVVLAEWSDWDGHWVCLIGLDNNGTPNFRGDDVLILADPYDTMDHWQDGYTAVPIDRFFYMWKDRAIETKPYQLQPFLVIARD